MLLTIGPRIGAVRRIVTTVPGERWASLRACSSASILSAKYGSPVGARRGCFSVRKFGLDGLAPYSHVCDHKTNFLTCAWRAATATCMVPTLSSSCDHAVAWFGE